MSATQINTVTGPISPDDLGVTLMHEHLVIGFPGWESNTMLPRQSREEMVAVCVGKIIQLQDRGVKSMLDPTPNDIGRDVELAAEVSSRTGFQIICATGLYHEHMGGSPYWRFRGEFGKGAAEISELFITEITKGVGDTGIKAGIIKVASGEGEITEFERTVLEAAAMASIETGAPITTHTDRGTMGDEQQRILTNLGVPPNKIIIGHSCGTTDFGYHMKIAKGGSYIGFDRIGLEPIMPDAKRIEALLALIKGGAGQYVVVSHDSVWCAKGEFIPSDVLANMPFENIFDPNHFHDQIIPQLLAGGATQDHIDQLLIYNPRRFFSDEAPSIEANCASTVEIPEKSFSGI